MARKIFAPLVAIFVLSAALSAQISIGLTQTGDVYSGWWNARLDLTGGTGSVTISKVQYKVNGSWQDGDAINDTVVANPNNTQNYTFTAAAGATHATIITSAGESNTIALTYGPV